MTDTTPQTGTKTIELLFDFVSPNAYLIWQPLKKLAADHGAKLNITPVFLGGMHKLTGNAPPFIRDGEVKGKNAYAMLEMNRFIAAHQLTKFKMNPKFPFNSITLQRMVAATEGAQQDALIEALLTAIWEGGVDVTDPQALQQTLEGAGLNAEELLASTQDPAVKQKLVSNTDHAVERGAFGIPTMFVTGANGEEMFFGKERLAQIAKLLAG